MTDVGGLNGATGYYLFEGELDAQSNGLTYRYGDDAQPADTDGGPQIPVGGGRTFGPVYSFEAAWDLRKLWVRNTTPGSNATVVFVGRTA